MDALSSKEHTTSICLRVKIFGAICLDRSANSFEVLYIDVMKHSGFSTYARMEATVHFAHLYI